MTRDIQPEAFRPVRNVLFFALAAIGTALASILIPSGPIKITLLVLAGALIAATGASLSILLAPKRRP